MRVTSSHACMSPAWFSTAILTPASRARLRTFVSTFTVLVDLPLDAALDLAVLAVAENAAHHRRAERAGDADGQRQVLLRRAVVLGDDFDVGQMLKVPTWISSPRSSAFCFRSRR